MHLTYLIVIIIVIIIVVMIVRRESQSDEDREREEDRFRLLLGVLVVGAVAVAIMATADYSSWTTHKDHDEGQEYGGLAERRANAVRKKRVQLAEAEAKIGKGLLPGYIAGKRAKNAELKRQSAKKEAARVLMEQP